MLTLVGGVEISVMFRGGQFIHSFDCTQSRCPFHLIPNKV